MNYKRILIVAGFAALTFAIGYGIYFAFFRSSARAPIVGLPTNAPGQPGGTLPSAREGGPTRPGVTTPSETARGGLTLARVAIAAQVSSPTRSADGTTTYYDQARGKFYRLNADGSISALSDKQFYNVQSVAWNRTGSRAVLEYPDGSKIMVDFNANTQVTLPRQWQEISWTPDASKIVSKSLGASAENNFLVISDPDGSNAVAVAALGDNANRVQIAPSPTGGVVGFSRTGEAQGFGKEEVLLVGSNNQNLKSFLVDGIGFAGAWSPSGRRLLWSAAGAAAGYRPSLATAEAGPNGVSPVKRAIGLATWVDKCTVVSDELAYCAAPQNLPDGAGLAREAVENYPDEFYRVNLITGATSFLARPSEPVTAENLMISADGATLLFRNKLSGQLMRIKLQ